MKRIKIKMSVTNKIHFIDSNGHSVYKKGYTFAPEEQNQFEDFHEEIRKLSKDIYVNLVYEIVYYNFHNNLISTIWIEDDKDAFFLKGWLWNNDKYSYTD